RAAGEAVRKGPLAVISLMVLISVNLGILNLLPIPILDGGNILLLTLEGIRRRDFSLACDERFVQVGFVFLLVLFAYVMYNDVVRMLPIHSCGPTRAQAENCKWLPHRPTGFPLGSGSIPPKQPANPGNRWRNAVSA